MGLRGVSPSHPPGRRLALAKAGVGEVRGDGGRDSLLFLQS